MKFAVTKKCSTDCEELNMIVSLAMEKALETKKKKQNMEDDSNS